MSNFRNDSIFLLAINTRISGFTSGPYEIYELVQERSVMIWKNFAKYGHIKYEMEFPKIITPMKNGKFVFFPQKNSKVFWEDESYLNFIEIWKKNDTLSKSSMVLPSNLTNDSQFSSWTRKWIFQL